jgi:3alpha(or 20beta)-hydroxysteroid dehydrogenase
MHYAISRAKSLCCLANRLHHLWRKSRHVASISAMGRVEGKVVIISGGARGMGAAHARILVGEGARVVVADILDDEGRALASQLGDSARFVHLDVTDAAQWCDAVAATLDWFGRLDVLVNNAGILNGNYLRYFELAEWRRAIDVNLTGTFLGIQVAIEPMIAAGGGSIINISSIEGMRGSVGLHGYVASKWAVRGLTKSAALELAPHRIRVNSIHPGVIHTPMTAAFQDDVLQIPMGRAAEPEEVSACVLYLASEESSYSTAAEFVIDGGVTAGLPMNITR